MNTVIWLHADALRADHPVFQVAPDAPTLFVWDDALLREWQISLKRVVFIYECLLELPVTIRRGDVVQEVVAFAQAQQAQHILTPASPSPRHRQLCQQIVRQMPKGSRIDVFADVPFVEAEGELDLKRFSRYWSRVKSLALRP